MQNAPYDPHPQGFTDFFESLGRPVVFYPSLARMLKSIKAAVFLGQLLYWTPKAQDPDGWVYKDVESWERETGMTYREQRQARKDLARLRLLEERYSRLDHRLYFRVNRKILNDLWAIWSAAFPPDGVSEVPHLTKGQMGKLRKPRSGTAVLSGRINEFRDDFRDDNRETPPNPQGGGEGFDLFWGLYPKKVAEIRARREWSKLNPDPALVEEIIAAVKRQAATPEWTKDSGRWIPAPTGWLRDRRWKDEVRAQAQDPDEIERRRKILASVGVESRHMSPEEINEAHRKRFGAKNWRDDAKDSTARAAGFKDDADMQERIRAGIGSHDPWPPGHPRAEALPA